MDVEVGGGLHARERSVHGKVVTVLDHPLQMLLELVGELRHIPLVWDFGVPLLHAVHNQRHVSMRVGQRERLPLVIRLSLAHVHVAVVAVKKRHVGSPSVVSSVQPQLRQVGASHALARNGLELAHFHIREAGPPGGAEGGHAEKLCVAVPRLHGGLVLEVD